RGTIRAPVVPPGPIPESSTPRNPRSESRVFSSRVRAWESSKCTLLIQPYSHIVRGADRRLRWSANHSFFRPHSADSLAAAEDSLCRLAGRPQETTVCPTDYRSILIVAQ